MSQQSRTPEAPLASDNSWNDETSPLMRPMSASAMGAVCTATVIASLAICWCILDYWNHQVSSDLFEMGNLRVMILDDNDMIKGTEAPFDQFAFPLTLAFMQFAFMGVFFTLLYYFMLDGRPSDLSPYKFTSDRRWPVLVASHVFSTFWLQALIMPATIMSVGLFAASRAVEIPMAAVLRSQVMGIRMSRKMGLITGMTFAAVCTLFFSYGELAGCVCIWSGNGVALSGLAFWIIYLLILGVPATNAVCTESILSQPGVHALQLLALQNLFACLLFSPILLLSHVVGWEDVGGGLQMIATQPQVFLLVLWLCAQMTASSVVCTMLIQIANSFWTIALRAVRVVLWALLMTGAYYMQGADELLSISCPHSSLYGFVMLCGVLIGTLAMYMDWKAEEEVEKSAAAPTPVSSIVGAGERALSTAGAGKATAGP
mmetsp:Transcript_1418/g.2505  ORF Transcript_1418/g.2505 Transcript_1418/m.2505 type:complete len:430 (-) Transcript_1418:107-1396(-)